jgi:hypothetical protein
MYILCEGGMLVTLAQPTGKRWNLFARELEDILRARNAELGLLDDRAKIHREKVRRLQQSLLKPKSFPTLTPEELDRVAEVFHLDDIEIMRLRAALLVTAIERTLMDRINQDDGLRAAEMMLPVVQEESALGTIRGRDYDFGQDSEEQLDSIIDYIDAAQLEIHLSRNVASHSERIEHAYQARKLFEMALAALDEADEDVQALQVWHVWHSAAAAGVGDAANRLEELGE